MHLRMAAAAAAPLRLLLLAAGRSGSAGARGLAAEAGGGWGESLGGAWDRAKARLGLKAEAEEALTFKAYAAQMRRARQMGSLASRAAGQYDSGTQKLLEFQERIADEIADVAGPLASEAGDLSPEQRAGIARKLDCDLAEVENCLRKHAWAKDAVRKVNELKARGEAAPKTFEELNALVGGDWKGEPPPPVRSAKVRRNAPCPCGSGKKHKKCCASKG